MRPRRDATSPWWQTRGAGYAVGVLVVLAAAVVVALIPSSSHKTLSNAQLRRFGPICASSGHISSVVAVGRSGSRTLYRVHCSGGLKTLVVR